MIAADGGPFVADALPHDSVGYSRPAISSQGTDQLIILADDAITTLSMVSARLQRTGYETVTTTRGDEALELILARRPILVVLDIEMPGIGGIEVTRRLRGDPSFAEMPIILLTAHSDDAHVQAGLDAGADSYMVKPFSPQELATLVDELLGRR
jgi:two-component system phosphate regulon response regulator PhoB